MKENDPWINDVRFELVCNNNDLNVDRPNTEIVDIVDFMEKHISSKVVHRVEGLWIHHANVIFIPKGIGNFFKNLEGLWIQNSNLMHVEKDDFAQFPNLRCLHIHRNKLTSLSGDLFDSAPKLLALFIEKNPIKYIGDDILEPLKELEQIDFTRCSDQKHFVKFSQFSKFDETHQCDDQSLACEGSKEIVEIVYANFNDVLSIAKNHPCFSTE